MASNTVHRGTTNTPTRPSSAQLENIAQKRAGIRQGIQALSRSFSDLKASKSFGTLTFKLNTKESIKRNPTERGNEATSSSRAAQLERYTQKRAGLNVLRQTANNPETRTEAGAKTRRPFWSCCSAKIENVFDTLENNNAIPAANKDTQAVKPANTNSPEVYTKTGEFNPISLAPISPENSQL